MVSYMVFDLLALDGEPLTGWSYGRRRDALEALELEGPAWQMVASFDHGEALWRVVCKRRLEGVVAKRTADAYRPGDRGWVKRKNQATARFAEEREAAIHLRSRTRIRLVGSYA